MAGFQPLCKAVIRSPAGNWHTLEDFLARHNHPTQWQLEWATAISADGKTVVGRGINPSGTLQGFAITIPEPSSWLLLAIGTGLARVVARLRRNSAR